MTRRTIAVLMFFKRRAFLVAARLPADRAVHLVRRAVLRVRRLSPARDRDRAADRDRAGRRLLGRVGAAQAAARQPRERQARRRRCSASRSPRRSGRPPKPSKLRERFEEAVATLKQTAAQRPQPVRPAVVRDHRRARLRQDDGARQLGAEVSAGAAGRQGRAARRRRHAQLRLVVHRRSGVSRHRRPLHHAGLRRGVRQRRLGGVPRAAAQVPQAPSGQRRHPHDQRAGPDDAGRRRPRGARRGGAPPAERAQSGAAHPAAGLRDGDQVRPGRRLHRVLRRSDAGGPRAGLGRDVPVRADAERRGAATRFRRSSTR